MLKLQLGIKAAELKISDFLSCGYAQIWVVFKFHLSVQQKTESAFLSLFFKKCTSCCCNYDMSKGGSQVN